MKNLLIPDRANVRPHLETALEIKTRKGVTTGYPVNDIQLAEILSLYDAYDGSNGLPNPLFRGDNLDEALTKEILSAYRFTQKNGRLSKIRETLKNGVEQCPICGISAPDELDHYLPKSEFPTLAIYVRNLVPICGTCNKKKSAIWSENGNFFHPYFDILPDLQFLEASVTIENNGLIVEFKVNSNIGLDAKILAKLRTQLAILSLNDRYSKELNIYLASQAISLLSNYESQGQIGVEEYLRRQGEYEARRFYPNHWRPTLLNGLRRCNEFIDGGFRSVLGL